jgi:biopolymer transport protein ExbD
MPLALKRRPRPPARITLVPMVDVMTIMLVFFMVTSTYLDLNMVPAAEKAPEGTDTPDPGPKPGPGDAGVLMIRIAPDGSPEIRGQRLDPAAFAATLAERLAATAGLQVVVLPSPEADMQALISVMDAATRAGAGKIRVIRLEAKQ